MEFSEKLITLRKGRDLTQEQLAEQLNVSRQSISKWESGQVIPEVERNVYMVQMFCFNHIPLQRVIFELTYLILQRILRRYFYRKS